MGAENTKIQTVHINNPDIPREGIEITQNVLKRLESEAEAQNQQHNQHKCTCCVQNESQQEKGNYDVYIAERNSQDLASINDKVDQILTKPPKWPKEVQTEIKRLREEVLQCYKLNVNRPLHCSEVAANFNDYVLAEQTKLMFEKKMNGENKIEGQEKEKKGQSPHAGKSSAQDDSKCKDEYQKLLNDIKKKEEELKKKEEQLRKREEDLKKRELARKCVDAKNVSMTSNINDKSENLFEGSNWSD